MERISCPIPMADFPSEPLPRRIAISSLELRAWAPWVLSLSRGRSQAGSSRIVLAILDTLRLLNCFSKSEGLTRREGFPAPESGTNHRGAARGRRFAKPKGLAPLAAAMQYEKSAPESIRAVQTNSEEECE